MLQVMEVAPVDLEDIIMAVTVVITKATTREVEEAEAMEATATIATVMVRIFGQLQNYPHVLQLRLTNLGKLSDCRQLWWRWRRRWQQLQ